MSGPRTLGWKQNRPVLGTKGPRLTQYPMAMKLGPGSVIAEITLGVRCPHCDTLLQVGDTPFCPHKVDAPGEAK